MSVIYIANVGNRDVKHDGIDKYSPRLIGKNWLERFDNVCKHLDFPIIRKGLESVLENLGTRPVDKVVLFFTDQDPDATEERHWQNDTLYFADLTKKLILEKLSGKVIDIELIKITGAPYDYDEMFTYYSKKLEKINNTDSVELAFLAPAGGIPACNMGLVMHGSRIFGVRSQAILISEVKDATPKYLNIASEIIRSHNRSALNKMLDNFNFGGVDNLLATAKDSKDISLRHLAQYVQYRLSLDFTSALEILDQANFSLITDDSVFIEQIRQDTIRFTYETEPLHSAANENVKKQYCDLKRFQLCEICLNALIKYKSRQYTDFVGRIFRLQEGAARWFFEYYTGYSTNIGRKFSYKDDFDKYSHTPAGKDFVEYLKKKKRKNYRYEPNRIILTKFWDFYLINNSDSSKDLYPEMLTFCKKIDNLGDLRNESSLAHGFAAITAGIIADKYHKGIIMDDVQNVPTWLKTEWDLEVFNKIAEIIRNNY